MSSCLSGGGRAYGFELDKVMKPAPVSTSSSSLSTHSSSPSSTLSEASNSPLAISTKKPRTPRKRPNQTCTEAAALLAKIYPNIFSTKNLLRSQCKFSKARDYLVESSELLPPFPGIADAGFLLHGPVSEQPASVLELKAVNSIAKCYWSHAGCDFREPTSPCIDDDDFDAESILDEEMSEGIDSILGNSGVDESTDGPTNFADQIDPYLGYQPGSLYGLNITSALKHVGNGDWWCSPTVEMNSIVSRPKQQPTPEKKKKKKKKKLEKIEDKVSMEAGVPSSKCEAEDPISSSSSIPRPKISASCLKPALSLSLNFEGVIKEWADGGSPFSEVPDSSESPADIIAKLSDIDLFSETAGTSGIREASVLRYKEKRRSRLFSKKIRYQARKLNADIRPRMKENGRFTKKDGGDDADGDDDDDAEPE